MIKVLTSCKERLLMLDIDLGDDDWTEKLGALLQRDHMCSSWGYNHLGDQLTLDIPNDSSMTSSPYGEVSSDDNFAR